MGIRISRKTTDASQEGAENNSIKTSIVLQEDIDSCGTTSNASLDEIDDTSKTGTVSQEDIDNSDKTNTYDTVVENKSAHCSINSSGAEKPTQQPEESTRHTEHSQQHGRSPSGDTQFELKEFERESTGTSGYSSQGYMSTLNSVTGTRLQSEFRTSMKKGLNEEDQRKILNKFRYIKGEIDAEILSDYFLQDNYFNNDDIDDISSLKPRYKQVAMFLLKLIRLKPEAYMDFLSYLKEAGYGHVCNVLEEPIFTLALNHEDITAVAAQSRFTRYKDDLINQLEPDEVADIFVEYEEFSIDEYEEIMAEKTRRAKTQCILRLLMLPEHTHRGYLVLMQALKETDKLYLLTLFEQTFDEYQHIESPKGCTINVRPYKIKKRETTRATKILKDSDQCQLIIKIQSEEDIRQLEVGITKELDTCAVMVSINNEIILDKECLITKAEHGSIVITLKGCGPFSLQRMFSKGIQGPITDILHHIFLHPNIRKLIPTTGLQFDLTLNCLPSEYRGKKTDSDLILTHMDFLVEELDALSFLKIFEDKAILTAEEIKAILDAKPTSRKTRTKAMLEIILGKHAVGDFVDVLKKKKKYVWEHVFQSNDSLSQAPINAVAKSYNELADNMSPTLIAEECCTTTFILSDLNSYWSREQQARYILQQVLKQDFGTKLHFVNILSLYDQIPPEMMLKTAKGMQKSITAPGNAGKKAGPKQTSQPIELFVADFVVSTKERRGMKPVKVYCGRPLNPISITRSITRRLEKTTWKTRAGKALLPASDV